jgi:hypothetical protein
VIFEALLWPLLRNTVRHSSRNTAAVGQSGQEIAGAETSEILYWGSFGRLAFAADCLTTIATFAVGGDGSGDWVD